MKAISFIVFSCFFIGCATTNTGNQLKINHTQNVTSVIKLIVDEIEPEISKKLIPIPIYLSKLIEAKSQKSNLESYLLDQFTSSFESSSKFEVLNRRELINILNDFRVTPGRLHDQLIREKFSKSTQAEYIFFINTEPNNSQDDEIKLQAWLLHLSSGKKIKTNTKTILKNTNIRNILGETIPGTLKVITDPINSKVHVDSKFIGNTVKNGLILKLNPGVHDLKIDFNNFSSFKKQITVKNGVDDNLFVKFEKDNLAPIKSLLISAFVPGLSSGIYSDIQSPAREWNARSALIFYVLGISYIWDSHIKDHDFFTTQQDKNYRLWTNIELAGAIGAYAVNLITSVIIGNEQKNRTMISREITTSNNNSKVNLTMRNTNDNRAQFNIYYYF